MAYGWTDDQIFDQLDIYGASWLESTWKLVLEDKVNMLRWLTQIAPLARTPQDKKSARGLRDYERKVQKVLNDMVPWTRNSRLGTLQRQYGKQMGDSQILVVLDENDNPDDPLYEGAKFAH